MDIKIFFKIFKILSLNILFPKISKSITSIDDNDYYGKRKALCMYFTLGIISFYLKKDTNTLLMSYIITDNIHDIIAKLWPNKDLRNMFLYSLCSMIFVPTYFNKSNTIHKPYRLFLSKSMNSQLSNNYLGAAKISMQSSIPYILIYIITVLIKKDNKLQFFPIIERFSRSSLFIFIASYIMKKTYKNQNILGHFLTGLAFINIEHPSQFSRILKFVWAHTLYSKLITL